MAIKLPKMKKVAPLELADAPAQVYTDLREVMDYSRPLSIFFSGVEYEEYLDILYDLGIRNFLMSYEYLKGKGRQALKKYPDMHLFIDSGAYTYQVDPQYESWTIEQWEQQIETYLAWAKKHKDSIFAIADLDLQYVVGSDIVYEWRKRYFEPFMLETGIPVCFIYHDEGLDQWEYMCKRYPYVGLSLAIDKQQADGEAQLCEMFRIAEKYNSLCQGMASTNTALLTQYPFYTVDSTTWNVGLKYGEISVWRDTKMSRVKKTDFEDKAFPAIARYDHPFDLDLIRVEDKTEMIKVNAYAFVQAEKFVRDRLKARMYWLKAKTKRLDLNSLPADYFPSPAWFNGAMVDIKDYAEKMNINPEYEQLRNLLYDATAFVNWDNPQFRSMKDWYSQPEQEPVIVALHDLYVNRIVPDTATRIQDLIRFFRECVSGENDKLLQLGTNFDRMVKERDSYIEEEDIDYVDVDDTEVKKRLSEVLSTSFDEEGAPEIDELDEEIFSKVGLVPTWSPDGKFVKGQIAVRKPKQLYSNKFPKFACDTCYAAQKCPEYKAGTVCAYHKMFARFDTRDMGDIIQAMQGMVQHNLTRMQRAMLMEVLNGTNDDSVTAYINQNMQLLGQLQKMYENASPEVLRQTRVMRADGTQETTTEYRNPGQSSILEKIFGGMMSDDKDKDFPDEDIVEVVPDKPKELNARYTVEDD